MTVYASWKLDLKNKHKRWRVSWVESDAWLWQTIKLVDLPWIVFANREPDGSGPLKLDSCFHLDLFLGQKVRMSSSNLVFAIGLKDIQAEMTCYSLPYGALPGLHILHHCLPMVRSSSSLARKAYQIYNLGDFYEFIFSCVGYFIPLPGFDRRLILEDYLSFVSGSVGK